MATNSDLLLNNPTNLIKPSWGWRVWNWLVQPNANLPLDTQRRLRFFNILLITQIFAELIGTLLIISANPAPSRLAIAGGLYFLGAIPAYILSRAGLALAATWANGLGTLVALSYYILTAPRENPTTPYFDLRSTAMLMVLPIIITGMVSGPRACISLLVVSVTAFLWVSTQVVRNVATGEPVDFFWYQLVSFRLPTAFLLLTGILALVFERNIFGLFDSLNSRNARLQTVGRKLAVKRERAAGLTHGLSEILTELDEAFEEQLASADQQQMDMLDVSSGLEELGRIARRIDNLANQAGQVATEATIIASQKAEIIKNNAIVYGRLLENMEAINRAVEELAVEARQIDQVVSSVSEVAEETNLLALNASIESAGRREHGRRFSAVAAEVGRSAQRSREAAEEVRQVVSQIQSNVSELGLLSLEARQEAEELSQSTRSSSRTINEIVTTVENSAQISQTILADVKAQQVTVIGILDVVPGVAAKSDEMRRFTLRLLQSVHDLEQALADFSQLPLAHRLQPSTSAGELDEERDEDEGAFSWQTWRRMSWKRRWIRLTLPNSRLAPRERRRSRLLNLLSLSISFFLLVYIPLSQLDGFDFWHTFLPQATLLGVMLTVYGLSRAGAFQAALLVFFGSVYAFFSLIYFLLPDQLSIIDFIKTASVLLGLLALVAATIANLRWIIWLTTISSVLITVLAYWRFERTLFGTFIGLVSPLVLVIVLGLLAAFLDYNITRLADQLDIQNRSLAQNNRELIRQERQETHLSQQIYALAADLGASSDHQSGLAITQFNLVREITGRVSVAERGAVQLITATQQVVQIASNAYNQAQQGAIGIESSLHGFEEFQLRVAGISASSQDLQTQTIEIEQTFLLINDVADEVDLLALNATVEATQARAAGKRFAAVAGEVQRLAGRARSASGKVTQIVERIQNAVGECVRLTEAGQHEIHFLSETAYDTSRSVQEIVQTVNNTYNLVHQIQDAVLQQSQAIGQALNRLQTIGTTGEIFRENTRETVNVIARLNETATELSQVQTEAGI